MFKEITWKEAVSSLLRDKDVYLVVMDETGKKIDQLADFKDSLVNSRFLIDEDVEAKEGEASPTKDTASPVTPPTTAPEAVETKEDKDMIPQPPKKDKTMRVPKEDLAKRNEQIWSDHCGGMTNKDIATKYGLTPSTVSMTLKKLRSEKEPDDSLTDEQKQGIEELADKIFGED